MIKYKHYLAIFLAACMALTTACGGTGNRQPDIGANTIEESGSTDSESGQNTSVTGDGAEGAKNSSEDAQPDITDTIPLNVIDDNYRTYYEVFVYSFCDSDGDGIGDLQGLISKLDYINDGDDTTDTDLGCNGIWLMPVHPSPTYHKYDVVDYYDIDPAYGTLEDFKEFLAACEDRGIKVIMDLVINHSSSQHPWFKEACAYLRELGDGEPNAEECPYVDYYHFSRENASGYSKVAGADWYYEAQFWSEMPDLNLGSEALREEIGNITKYWLDMGVGGFRLDAVKEYYTGDVQANIEVLSWFTEVVKSQKEDAYLVGEAWSNMSEYSQYYSSGMDSLFDFAFADAEGIISKVLKSTSARRYGETVASLQETFGQYNENYIDAPFYTNHDMGRSAGYYVGGNSQAQTKLAGALNLFMSGSAFLYYGEELGMRGAGKDENKRAPMYWSKDVQRDGMCDGPADMDDFEMIYDSLEEQEQDASSIYQFYKKVIKIRNQNPEIARGEVEYLSDIPGERFCVLKKTWEGSEILVIFHIGEETEELDVSNLSLNGAGISADNVRGALETGEEKVAVEDGKVTMPGFSALVLK